MASKQCLIRHGITEIGFKPSKLNKYEYRYRIWKGIFKMDEQTKKLASLNEREAENMAVEQFTKLYNEIDEKWHKLYEQSKKIADEICDLINNGIYESFV